jgi:HlyD family secretion protein
VAGVVVSREVDLGQTVAASFQTPTLFKIARDLSRMQIDSNVAEADIGKVRVGQAVRFSVDAFPDRKFEGRVQQIRLAPITQQNVVTYNVVVEVSNPDLVLMPGMTAYLSIVTDRAESALLVPNAALRFRPTDSGDKPAPASGGQARAVNGDGSGSGRRIPGGGNREPGASPKVYIVHDGELTAVPLEIGISDGRRTVVRSGALKEGDRLVVEDLKAAPKTPTGGNQPFRMRPF